MVAWIVTTSSVVGEEGTNFISLDDKVRSGPRTAIENLLLHNDVVATSSQSFTWDGFSDLGALSAGRG
jgi:hypothetical protein